MDSHIEIPFQKLLDALLDEQVPFNPRYLYRFADLEQEDLASLKTVWDRVSVRRRQALLEDLEELGERDYLLSFEAIGRFALQDADPQVRTTAVRLLWEYEQPDLAPIFLRMISTDSDVNVRAAATSALGKYVYLGEIDELPESLLREIEDRLLQVTQGTDQPLVRRRALESLGYSSREEVKPLIQSAYDSGDRDWLSTALFAMGRSANEDWEEQVLQMLEHTQPAIRMEAVRAAGELELSDALDTFIELLEDSNEDVRMAAIWSLSQIGGEGVRDILEGMLETSEDDQETELLETALDNLAFTEDLQLMPLFDLPEGDTDLTQDDADEIEDLDFLDLSEGDDFGDSFGEDLGDDFEDDEDY